MLARFRELQPDGHPHTHAAAQEIGSLAMRVAESFEALRPMLFSLAYRMLGSVSEAEDVVQEAFLRQQRALRQDTEIDAPKAYLSAVVTRLSIDQRCHAEAMVMGSGAGVALRRVRRESRDRNPRERAIGENDSERRRAKGAPPPPLADQRSDG